MCVSREDDFMRMTSVDDDSAATFSLPKKKKPNSLLDLNTVRLLLYAMYVADVKGRDDDTKFVSMIYGR